MWNIGPLVPINPEEHIAVGVAKGAPRAALEASVVELGTSTAKGLVNLVCAEANERRTPSTCNCFNCDPAVSIVSEYNI